MKRNLTYRLFSPILHLRTYRIVVLRNVQMQVVLVGEIPPALCTPMRMHLLVVYVIFLKRRKHKWLVRRQRALHDWSGRR